MHSQCACMQCVQSQSMCMHAITVLIPWSPRPLECMNSHMQSMCRRCAWIVTVSHQCACIVTVTVSDVNALESQTSYLVHGLSQSVTNVLVTVSHQCACIVTVTVTSMPQSPNVHACRQSPNTLESYIVTDEVKYSSHCTMPQSPSVHEQSQSMCRRCAWIVTVSHQCACIVTVTVTSMPQSPRPLILCMHSHSSNSQSMCCRVIVTVTVTSMPQSPRPLILCMHIAQSSINVDH